MIKGGLELQSFWVKDTEALDNAEKFNIEIPDESITTKPITFYVIDNVQESGDEDTCVVQSGGEDFFIAESAKSVNQKIKERQKFLYN